ncbi:pilus-assembly fibrillin subunit [Photobacterium damselae]|uniref:pilus-assembly fibrillin subunit n=1 Tax=Photobacterium damselae TaxID=38293 RepID=UPI004067779E
MPIKIKNNSVFILFLFISSSVFCKETNPNSGLIRVQGALVTSPCRLDSNEIIIPQKIWHKFNNNDFRYRISLELSGCSDDYNFLSPVYAQQSSYLRLRTIIKSQQIDRIGVSMPTVNIYGGKSNVILYLSSFQYHNSNNIANKDKTYIANGILKLLLDYQ